MKDRIINFFKNRDRIYFLLLFLLSATLLFYRIDKRTFWMDEGAVLEYLYRTPNPFNFLINYFSVPDNHPPLYYFLVIALYKVLPLKEAGIRLVSVLSGLGIVATVYYFVLLLFKNKTLARIAMFLTAISSYFILISQMARYHSLAALLALLSLYYFAKLVLEGYSKKSFNWCLFFGVLTAYTDLPHFVYLIGLLNIFYFFNYFRKNQPVKLTAWIKGQVVLFLLFLPVVWLFYLRIFKQGDGGFEKISLLGRSFSNWASDFLMHFYAYFFGENILPWNWPAFAAGIVVSVFLIIFLVKIIRKKDANRPSLFLLVYLFLGVIILNTIFMNYADPRYNFIVYPKFGFVAFPLFIMLVAYVIWSCENVWLRRTIFLAFVAVQIFGLNNFYQSKNYLNASYFNDFKGYQFVKDSSHPGDILIISGDLNIGVYDFYKDSYFKNLTPVFSADLGMIAPKAGTRYWFFATSADGDSTAGQASTADKIPPGFKVVDKYESVPIDLTLKKLKEKVLHRESYLYKYGVFLLAHN